MKCHWVSRHQSAALFAVIAAAMLIAWRTETKAQTSAPEKLKAAFFGFELINTSPQLTSDAERRRLVLLEDTLIQILANSGRYQVMALPEALKSKIGQSAEIESCNSCQIGWAREAGADLAVWGTVQKVSNLILNENVYIDDVRSGSRYFAHSVDIRGNTDESWVRGMRYLLQNYLLEKR